MPTLQENLKMFYLGLDGDEPFLYKNKDLTTHALIIGMTGSGKTGLGITLLEEACIDNIPSIIIDPKGDLTNLALSFKDKNEFLPFCDNDENKANECLNALKNGLKESFQDLERVELLKRSAEVRIFTPKSSAGLGVNLLGDFSVPEFVSDDEALNTHTLSLANSILALAGLSFDDSTAPEILLIQSIFNENFKAQKALSIATLINQIITPPFDKIGVFALSSFYPEQKRMNLAMKINALVASPSFKAWCDGQSLNISKMLFNENGKARANVFSIAHLNEAERMFFTTILLNSMLSWMRSQSGTTALRAILYMDEIYGYFPPNANTPSKAPMMTLLKQARAFGLGCVLSTQNPSDIDYKGLSNIGTWFIGHLQTVQDKERVINGLLRDSSDKESVMNMLNALPKRTFLVKNINENSLCQIITRYALSYLKGPLDKKQISFLMKGFKENSNENSSKNSTHFSSAKPALPSAITQSYCQNGNGDFTPYLYATAKVRFCDNKGLEIIKNSSYLLDISDISAVCWDDASKNELVLTNTEPQNASYSELCALISGTKDFKEYKKSFKEFLYRNEKITQFSALGLQSKAGESKEEFLSRLQDKANELLEAKTDEFEQKFRAKESRILEKLRRADERVEKEKSDLKTQGINAALSIGGAIFGAIFGTSKSTNATKVISSVKNANRVLNEKNQLKSANENKEILENELSALQEQFNDEITELRSEYDIQKINIESKEISPKKSDIFDENVILVWKN